MADTSLESQEHTQKTIHALGTRMHDAGLLNEEQYQSFLYQHMTTTETMLVGMVNFAIMLIGCIDKQSSQEHQPKLQQDMPAQPVSKKELDAVPEINPQPPKVGPQATVGRQHPSAPHHKGD